MNYYLLSILGSPLQPLTYQSKEDIAADTLVEVLLNGRQKNAVIISQTKKPSFNTLDISGISDFYFSKEQMELAVFMSNYYLCSLGEAFSLFVSFDRKLSCMSVESDFDDEIKLSAKQNEALAFIKTKDVSLLFGDTGSGKTEIYMKLFSDAVREGRRAIFLMPEISLTPQMEHRLEEHFGQRVVMWHSKITKTAKEKILKRIRSGEVDIVAGARSALFTPMKDVGVIVVDEEHDDSYKSSSKPRYNARDMAIYMGQNIGAKVILGSATPSLGSYAKFPSFRLKGGHFKADREYVYESSIEAITPRIEDEIRKVKQKNEQSIVFIPTRANFKYLICTDCGHKYQCPYCSVGMSVHQKSKTLKCHYCSFATQIPQVCPECKEHSLKSARLGTAEALKHLQDNLENVHIEQFDRDVITTQNKLIKTLKRFNDKEIDVLVGTQMLSKGHDYHDVTLAVVLGLDNMLNMSDYRAREKALSSLVQIAGRSGRKKEAKVIVQTFNREFFEAYIDDYERFLKDELEFRRGVYPPFKKLCRVLFAHKNGMKAQSEMLDMAERLKSFSEVEIVGFGPSAIEKIAGKYRFMILLRAQKSTEIIKAVLGCKNELAQIDMDPIEFA
ncbi:primosomal protein N' [Sulfurimonas sp. HSL-1716]|uniref:primosomal protein N' n=1 Tax=Hydrocurvibacter sulfurireducens TaxID=3131937 RepID=UPI0031F96124